ncbi:MAG: rod-binding protein [Pseudomonadota bacterium]
MTDFVSQAMGPPTRPAATQPSPAQKAAAEEFEAVFVAQMLKATGFGAPRSSLGGGAGEALFASLLIDSYAQALVDRGGLGLSDAIARQMDVQ